MTQKTPAQLRIRYVDPAKLNPHPDNPRDITPGAYARLKTIIATFGFVEPLVHNSRTQRLIGGHRRRLIAIELGIAKVPVTDVDLDEDQERALNVALNNREAQGSFDPAALTAFLAPIEQSPLLEATGFDFDQWQKIQIEAATGSKAGREGETPPVPATPKSRRGQTYQLGSHRLHIGDATEEAAYADMPGPAILCFTDPPYGVGYDGSADRGAGRAGGGGAIRGSRTRAKNTFENDPKDPGAYYALVRGALTQVAAHCTGAAYLCHATVQSIATHQAWLDAGYLHSSTIAWVKQHFVIGRSDYHWQWEPILYGWQDGHKKDRWWIGEANQGNVWDYDRPKRTDQGRRGPANVWRYARPGAAALHPTMKPVALVEHALRNSSPPGGLVLDCFAGSGSTLIAAENIGRTAYLIEIDPGYADVIITRWENLTGQKATKLAPSKRRTT